MKSSEVLTAAKELIRKPENWCQGALKRCGQHIQQYCSLGALTESDRCHLVPESWLQSAIELDTGYISVARWNDSPGMTHPRVIATFDAAIAMAEKAGD